MTINYSVAVKNARLAAMMALLDGGGGPGQIVLGTSALAGAVGVLASIPLQIPSFSIAGGVMTLNGVPLSAYASASGVVALAELRDSNGVTIASGLTVGVSGADLIVPNTTMINLGELATVSSGTIQHA